MPIKLSELSAKTREIEVAYAGDKVIATYYPGRFTPTLAAKLQDGQTAGGALVALVDVLAALLAGWDIVGVDGKPHPVTPECVGAMPLALLNKIAEAIGEDIRPKEATATTSFAP